MSENRGTGGQEFDQFASDYRSIHTENISRASGVDSEYFCEYKIKEIKYRYDTAPSMWMDLGCGDGLSAKFVRTYFPEAGYYGIDVSDESIRKAKSRGIDSAEFTLYDGRTFPFEDNMFDVVFVACVFHHILPEDRDGILDECLRVLKPGGRLIVFEHNTYNPVTREIVKDCVFDANAILLNEGKFRKQIASRGFRNIKRRFTVFFPKKKPFTALAGLERHLGWCMLGGQYYIVAEK